MEHSWIGSEPASSYFYLGPRGKEVVVNTCRCGTVTMFTQSSDPASRRCPNNRS